MAIKRTKEQKQHAQEKKEAELVIVPDAVNTTPERATHFSYSAQKSVSKPNKMIDGLSADATKYISSDLVKTLIVSLLLFGLLVGIYMYLRYN